MKTQFPPRMIGILMLGLMTPLTGQNRDIGASSAYSTLARLPGKTTGKPAMSTSAPGSASLHQRNFVKTQGRPYEISEDSLRTGLVMMATLHRESGGTESEPDRASIAGVQVLIAKLDLSAGETETNTKNPKLASEEVSELPNPLDRPSVRSASRRFFRHR